MVAMVCLDRVFFCCDETDLVRQTIQQGLYHGEHRLDILFSTMKEMYIRYYSTTLRIGVHSDQRHVRLGTQTVCCNNE
jgi:hypothetical protein